jgi:hypothetical protein
MTTVSSGWEKAWWFSQESVPAENWIVHRSCPTLKVK